MERAGDDKHPTIVTRRNRESMIEAGIKAPMAAMTTDSSEKSHAPGPGSDGNDRFSVADVAALPGSRLRPGTAGVSLESLTWPEAERAFSEDRVVVLPIGARCKEHGHHLPLNTDWIQAEYFSAQVARCCPVVLLPTLQYGYFPAFMEYPGSISISASIFTAMVVDICRSISRHGPRRFFALNMGLSTLEPLSAAKLFLNDQNVRLDYCDPRQLAHAERQALQTQPLGSHADELETSVMLYVAGDKVHLDRARPELAPDAPGPLTRQPGGPGVHSPTGAWGDPTSATAAKGKIIVQAMVRDLVKQIELL